MSSSISTPGTSQPNNPMQLQLGGNTSNTYPPPPSERSEMSKFAPSVSVMSDRSEQTTARFNKVQTAASVTSSSSKPEEIEEEDKKTTSRTAKKKVRRNRVSSALLLSKAKSSEGAIPLPLISNEQDRRPFFYHVGMREDEIVDATLDLVTKYRGNTSRDRAIQSLTVANAFAGKPWLGQVRLALNLTSNSLKHNVQRLRKVREKKQSALSFRSLR